MTKTTKQSARNSLVDVAKAAGVSVATVSRVLNGTNKERWASAAARAESIRRIAKELGYVPDWRARAFRSGRTNTVGVVYSGTNPMAYAQSYSPVFGGFGEVLHGAGYHMLFIDVPTASPSDLPVSALQSVDATVYFHKMSEETRPISRLVKGPCLLLNCEADLPASLKIDPDDTGGAKMLAEHLLELGHRKILFLDLCRPGAHFDHFSRVVRRNAIRQVMTEAGLGSGFMVWEYDIDVPLDEVVARYQQLAEAKQPTAIVYPYGISGLVIFNAFVRAGVRIPEDVSYAVFDDHELIANAVVPLTTVDVPFDRMGRTGAELLLEQLQSPKALRKRKVVVPERLIIRRSTARLPNRST